MHENRAQLCGEGFKHFRYICRKAIEYLADIDNSDDFIIQGAYLC